MAKVTVTCGTIDASYKGVVNPTLEAKFLQTDAERETYEPIMKKLQAEGLGTSGTTISGI